MNMHTNHQSPLKPALAPIRDGEHYRHLFSRAKWYILLSGPLLLLGVVAFVFLVVRPENPELPARALIGLEHTTDASGIKEGVTANLGREDIMMSRTFLRDVVRKLSLQLWTVPKSRDDMFDSVSIDSSVLNGTYCVRFISKLKNNDEFMICYYDTNAISLPFIGFLPGSKYDIIATGKWSADAPVTMQGISLKFSRSVRARPRAFTFRVVDIRVAVEAVYRNLTIKRADPEKGINYITVLLSDRDYSLSAETANAIADAFIEKNLSFRRQHERGVVGSLGKQLQLAQANLSKAESEIRDFRSANPQVGMNQQTQQTFNSLGQLDNGIQNLSADIINAKNLRKEYLNADSTKILQIVETMVDMLGSYSVPASKMFSEELNRLVKQQHELAEIYRSKHPLMLENKYAINKLSSAINEALDEFIENAQTAISKKQQNVKQISNRLRQLPALEMQLGELTRNREIYADIYSAVLGSFNKAKVADAVETTDFYIMDYAVAPLPPPRDPSRLLIICILVAIMATFGPVFVLDFFDKTVRTQRQLARISSNPVLEAIPIFFPTNDKRSKRKQHFHPLINVECNPNFTQEIFNSLLEKIKLRMFKSADHSIVVSSFEGGSGKSTISANLALAIAMRGHCTLLVDGDLRRGTVKEIFGLPDSGGLAALLSRHDPLTDDDITRSIVNTKIPNLYLIPSGREPRNPGMLLTSLRMEEFRLFCGKKMAYMVIDTPPVGIVSDAVVIQKFFNHYIFVVRSGKSRVADLVNRINEYEQLPDKILGYVLNGATHDAVSTYRRYSKYYAR